MHHQQRAMKDVDKISNYFLHIQLRQKSCLHLELAENNPARTQKKNTFSSLSTPHSRVEYNQVINNQAAYRWFILSAYDDYFGGRKLTIRRQYHPKLYRVSNT